MRACSTPMVGRSTSDAARMGEGSDAAAALLDRDLFQPYLEPGEKILWVGRPGRVAVFERWHRFALLQTFGKFALMPIVGIAVISTFALLKDKQLIPLYLLGRFIAPPAIVAGALFGVCSVFLFVGRVSRVSALKRLSYAVTTSRAMEIDRQKRLGPSAVALNSVDHFDVEERTDQSGQIVFGYRTEKDYRRRTKRVPRLTFEGIDSVAFVCALAKDAASKRRPGKRDG
jgi:hypothetical protein